MATRAQRRKRAKAERRKKAEQANLATNRPNQPGDQQQSIHSGTPEVGGQRPVSDADVQSPSKVGEGPTTAGPKRERSFSWRRQARFPTRQTPAELRELARLEGRDLLPVEKAVIAAVELLDGHKAEGESDRGNYRDFVRNNVARLDAAKLILNLEVANQDDDHAKLKRPGAGGPAIPVGGVVNAPGAQITMNGQQTNIGAQQNVAVSGIAGAGRSDDSDARRNRLSAISERLGLGRLGSDDPAGAATGDPETALRIPETAD